MSIHDWEQYGDEIRRTVQDAIENGNYESLNQSIKNTVNQATDWVSRNVRNSGGADFSNKNQGSAYHQPKYCGHQVKPVEKQMPLLYDKKIGAQIAAIFLAIFGYGLGVIFFLILIFGLLGMFVASAERIGGVLTVISASLLAVSAIMAWTGTGMLTKISRFKKYISVIGKREYCNISELASRIGKSTKFVVKDLEKMLKKGWFYQGYLDRQRTCLIVTNQMYQQYQQLEETRQLQLKEEEQRLNEERKVQERQAIYRKGLSPEVQRVIEQGDMYVQKIRACNDKIPGDAISAKISRMELLVDRIFDRVEQNPETVGDIRKLMDYYLPTAIKLLEAYEEMDSQPVGGENIQNAKKEIEDTLDTLNVAFEKLLDSLFQEKAWDVSSDISVLNMMLAQEGLKDDGLKK